MKDKKLSDDIDFIVDLKVLINALYLKSYPKDVKEIYNMFFKIHNDFKKWNLTIPYSDITSCSSLLKFVFWKLGISYKTFGSLNDINSVLETYYGSVFEAYQLGQQDGIVSIDMNNAYFSVIRLQDIWRFYICGSQELIDYEDLEFVNKIVDTFTTEKAFNPRLYKSLNYICYMKFKNAYLPLRYPSSGKYLMNMAYYSGEGWYCIADILAMKLFLKEDTLYEIVKVKKIQTVGLEDDIKVNLFGIVMSKHHFVDNLFELVKANPDYEKFLKFLMIMAYGNAVERFDNQLGRYFNPTFGTLTTSCMRLLTCVIRSMTNVYCVMSDNFVFDEKDIFTISKNFVKLNITFKIIGIGSIYINGTDRYYIWNDWFKKYSKHFLGTFINIDEEKINNIWENVVFGKDLKYVDLPILRQVTINNVVHYNLIVNTLLKRPLIGDCIYVTFGKTYISHDLKKLETLTGVLTVTDLKRIFLDINVNRITDCGFVLENEYLSKSEKSVFMIESSEKYLDSCDAQVGNTGNTEQEMIVI
ncbi:MAG: hypothetical protein M0R17_07210 [Candidatus Omnitrophica bacterium]|jgi:hypothetical protein|nr:hypothetical protein [Candidatus Omnitrophota bacterium]